MPISDPEGYTERFRNDAVQMVVGQGLSVATVARQLSLPESTLELWLSGPVNQRSLLTDLGSSVVDSLREPVLVLNLSLQVLRANQSFYQMFQVRAAETEGQLIFQLGNGQWDIPRLRQLLEEILPENAVFDDFEFEHSFALIGHKVLQLNARRFMSQPDGEQLILLAMEDVTERQATLRDIEERIRQRTAELIVAKEEAEREKEIAEAALAEIRVLKAQLEAERNYLQEEIKVEYNHEKIIGCSDALRYALHKIEQIATSNTTVLILGETGTGKELAARAIHGLSLRKKRALVKVNCATLPANLIESELFGHEKGAFTGSQARHLGRFEVAHNATLFLDEIGELPLELQAKLLRVIQDGEFERLGSSQTIRVDTRIIAATNRNLEEEVRQGRFREDLWYRLNVFPITMPPLRERMEDIPALVEFHVEKIAKRQGKTILHISAGVMASLQEYRWPGNIRELENVLERAVINSIGPKLRLADELKCALPESYAGPNTLEAVDRAHILRVLTQTNWKVSGKGSASEILGLDRSTLRARMAKLHISKT